MENRAEIKKEGQAFTATFSRQFSRSKEEAWEMLTDNGKLKQWFKELTFEYTGEGASLIFDMGDGQKERLPVTEFQKHELLAFDWWEDHVRFELRDEKGGTKLLLIETMSSITDQTAKDLAGWHVCLDQIANLLDGKGQDQMSSWEFWHQEYKRLLDSMTVEFE